MLSRQRDSGCIHLSLAAFTLHWQHLPFTFSVSFHRQHVPFSNNIFMSVFSFHCRCLPFPHCIHFSLAMFTFYSQHMPFAGCVCILLMTFTFHWLHLHFIHDIYLSLALFTFHRQVSYSVLSIELTPFYLLSHPIYSYPLPDCMSFGAFFLFCCSTIFSGHPI